MFRHALWRACAALLLLRVGAERLLGATTDPSPAVEGLLCGLWGSAGLLLLVLRGHRGRTRRRLLCAGLILLLAGVALLERHWRPAAAPARRALGRAGAGEEVWLVRGASAPVDGPFGPVSDVTLAARCATGGWLPLAPHRPRLRLSGARIPPGRWCLVRGRLRLWPERRNPAGRDRAADAWRRHRSIGRLHVIGPWAVRELAGSRGWIERASRPGDRIRLLGSALRGWAATELDRRLPQEATGLACAMTLGDRSRLPPALSEAFRGLGWSHLLALSGLHVGFVTGLALGLLHLGRCRRSGPPLALLLVGYALLTGASPSVVRATIMALAVLAARALCRPLGTGRALGIAALGCLTLAPAWLRDTGTLLSFSAVSGIVLLGPALDLTRPIRSAGATTAERWLLAPLRTGCAAQLGCLPVLAANFHAFSPWGVLTGPLAIPLAALTVGATLLGLLVTPLAPPLGGHLLDGAAVAALCLIRLGHWGVRHLSPPWPVVSPSIPLLALFLLGALLLGRSRSRGARLQSSVSPRPGRRRAIAACLGGCLLLGAVSCMLLPAPELGEREPSRARLELLDVGQGDAMLLLLLGEAGLAGRLGLRPSPRHVWLIDAGDATIGFDAGARVVLPRLRSLGVRALAGVILTHDDRDHVGGLPAVLDAMPVARITVPPGFKPPDRLQAALARRSGTVLDAAGMGTTLLERRGIRLRLLHPPPGYRGSSNDRSLVVVADLLGRRLLLTGDLEAAGEAVLCDRGGLGGGFDLLKVGHHGSASSTTPRFLAAVRPGEALVSVGADNRFGHPSGEVLARLRAGSTRIWRTDRQGAIQVRIDAAGWSLSAMLEGPDTGRRPPGGVVGR